MGRVVGADEDHGQIGLAAELGPGHLRGEVRAAGARHGDGGKGDLGPGVGQHVGQLAADRLGHGVDAHAERGRVAEQHQPQGRLAVLAERGAHGQSEVRLDVAARLRGSENAGP